MTEDRQEVSPEDVAEGFRAWAEFPREDVLALLQSLEAAVQGIAFNCPKSQDLENLTTALNAIEKKHEANAETLGDMAETLGDADARTSIAESLGKPGANVSIAETLNNTKKTLGNAMDAHVSIAETLGDADARTSIARMLENTDARISIARMLGIMVAHTVLLNENTKAIRSSIRYWGFVVCFVLLLTSPDALGWPRQLLTWLTQLLP